MDKAFKIQDQCEMRARRRRERSTTKAMEATMQLCGRVLGTLLKSFEWATPRDAFHLLVDDESVMQTIAHFLAVDDDTLHQLKYIIAECAHKKHMYRTFARFFHKGKRM